MGEQELLHREEYEGRDLVFVDIKYIKDCMCGKQWKSVCTWWRMRNFSESFLLETEKRLQMR